MVASAQETAMFVDVLPRWERWLYWISSISSILYGIYHLYLESKKYSEYAAWYGTGGLVPGWSFLGRMKDEDDIEWVEWKKSVVHLLVLCALRIIASRLIFHFRANDTVRIASLTAFDVLCIIWVVGVRGCLWFLVEALIIYGVIYFNSIAAVWVVVIIMIYQNNLSSFLKIKSKYLKFEEPDLYDYIVAESFFFMSLTSFAIEKIKLKRQQTSVPSNYVKPERGVEEREREKKSPVGMTAGDTTKEIGVSLLDLLHYSLHFPKLFDGPVFAYKSFHSEITSFYHSTTYNVDLTCIAKNLMRLGFWYFVLEFQFHFLYFSSISRDEEYMKNMSLTIFLMTIYAQGQFFMVKYVCIYGLVCQLVRFDGITPLPEPACISWLYSYTDIWKYFDVGLHNFVAQYIYIPIGGSRSGVTVRLFAIFMSFSFIFIWHGAERGLLIWCMGNCMVGCLEVIGTILENTSPGLKVKSYLSPAAHLRLKSLLIVPLFLTSSIQICFFFFPYDVGWAFANKMLLKATWPHILIQYFIYYSSVHNALYLRQRYNFKASKTFRSKKLS